MAGFILKFASKITKLFLSTFQLPFLGLNVLVVGQVAQVIVIGASGAEIDVVYLGDMSPYTFFESGAFLWLFVGF